MIYGTVSSGNTSATAGVQKNDTAFDQVLLQWCGHACYWRAKLHPDPVRISDANAYGIAKRKCNCNGKCECDGYGHSHSYSAVTYPNRKPKLHTELRIHLGDRNHRARHDRHRQPLR